MRAKGIEITEALHVNLFRMFFSRIDLRQHRKSSSLIIKLPIHGSMNMVDPNFFKQDSNVGNWDHVIGENQTALFHQILNSLHAWDWEIETTEELPPVITKLSLLLKIDDNDTHSVQVIASGPDVPG